MGIHLLINVLVTPVGLNKFKIDKVKDDSDTFRIDRFLTACSTLKEIHWDTVQIYLSLDPSWKLDYSNLDRLTTEEISHLREEAEKVRITAREIRIKSVGA